MYEQGNYSAAYKNFETAKLCTDLPSNNDLDTWMSKCIIVVKLSAKSLLFGPLGGDEQCIEVSTNAKSYKVGNVPEWCTVVQQGKMLYVSCGDNEEVVPREARIQITSGGKTAYFEVVQSSADLEMEFDPSTVVFSSQPEMQSVIVTSNIEEWTVETTPEWILAERKNDTLLLACTKNASADIREAEVELMADGQLFSLPVSQMPGDTVITASCKELVFPNEAKMEKFLVSCNMDEWTAVASDPWIRVTQKADSVTVVLQENPSVFSRHGFVTVASGARSAKVAIHQRPHVSPFTMPDSELGSIIEASKESIMVTSIPEDLVVYIDDSLARNTPFPLHVDYDHHSLLMGFERREILLNEKQHDVVFKPGLRFAQITFTAPKNIGLRTGFVGAGKMGAFAHFQASRPLVKEVLMDTVSPSGYHFMVGPVYQPIQYVGLYAGLGLGIYEGARSNAFFPNVGLNYEFGVMGFFKNATVSMGFRTTQWSFNDKRTTFVLGLGGYLKRYYDSELGYCASDSRRWWSLNYMRRPAENGKGVMFGDLGKKRTRAYIKALYLNPSEDVKSFDASFGLIFTPVNGLIDVCMGVGAGVNVQGLSSPFLGAGAELGAIVNVWRIPLTVMLHESGLFVDDPKMCVDLGFGFHLGEFNRSSYK